MSTNPSDERARVQNVNVVRNDGERPAWLIVGIGILMLLILLGFNVVTLIQTNAAQERQDRLSDCFRRVILTINARAEYNEDLRSAEAKITDAPAVFVHDLGLAQTQEDRTAATNKYLKTVNDARAERTRILNRQRQFKYPNLEDCEKA